MFRKLKSNTDFAFDFGVFIFIFVPIFEENGIFLLGVVLFLFSQFSSIEIIVFEKRF